MNLSVCVCTYNRADILKECLDSFFSQSSDLSEVEIMVVNNNSSDHTEEVCKGFEAKHTNFSYVLEKTQGLSYARNRAYKEAKSDWVCYLDDDALVNPIYCDQIIELTRTTDYECFGGPCLTWYKYGKPDWFKNKYVEYNFDYSMPSKLRSNQFLFGASMVFKKETLEQFNGFNPKLGMRGNTIGYGEETDLQMRMVESGMSIYWIPELLVDHLVPEYKLDIDWYFKSAFSLGRDSILMKSRNTSIWNLLLIGFTAYVMLILHLIWYTPQLLKKDYHKENWLLDVFRKIAKRIGIIYTALTHDS